MLVRCCDNEPRECINVARFLSKLDEFLHANDMLGAERCLRYWADEARAIDDKRGLLTVTNEQIGFYRRQGQTDKATEACYAALKLLDETGLRHSVSGETVVVNVATTLGAYGQTDLAAKLYDEAEQTFVAEGKQNTYEYAAFLNNKASTLYTMGKLDLAEDCLHRAVAVLTEEGSHPYDIAVSYCVLAQVYQKNANGSKKSLQSLDEAWLILCRDDIPRDGDYAYALTKCYPIFAAFGMDLQAEALRQTAEEIYGEAL